MTGQVSPSPPSNSVGYPIIHFAHTIGAQRHVFNGLKALLTKTSPARPGNYLAGLATVSEGERMAARMTLADVPLSMFLSEMLVPYEGDEVARLILDRHSVQAFGPIASLTVGEFRNWLLLHETGNQTLTSIAPSITPETATTVGKLTRDQDLIAVARKCRVVTCFRNTIGLPGRLSARLQSNHPMDNPKGITASIISGLLYGCGDATIGVNPASGSLGTAASLLQLVDGLHDRYAIPTQSCILIHMTNTIRAIDQGAPVDLVFQSMTGNERANAGSGTSLALLGKAHGAAQSLSRDSVGNNVMYFETGQGSVLSTNTHHGVDQQTMEVRAYAIARVFSPLLMNTVVDFIGPGYLYDGKQTTCAGLEDHFCGKLMGLPMDCDVCYTNHAETGQDDMDTLLTFFGVAGIHFITGIPGTDDTMLNYQSTLFRDALYLRDSFGLRPVPEFETWLQSMSIVDAANRLQDITAWQPLLQLTHAL